MQYIVNLAVPDDIAIVEGGRIRPNPKYPAKSREENLAETQAMVDAIIQRFSHVTILNVTPLFAVIETTQEIAVAIHDELGYDVASNRRLRR